MLAFALDADLDNVWECLGFDEPWNGWAAPIVDWETLIDVLQDAEWIVRTEGSVIYAAPDEEAIVDDEVVELRPDEGARYHLRDLGWTFVEVQTFDAKILEFARTRRSN